MKLEAIKYTLLLGAIAGLLYALALWGYDMVPLFMAHAAYAWLPGLTGVVLCVLTFAFAALLTYFFKRAWLGLLIWILTAIVTANWMIVIPIKIVPGLMKIIEPGLQSRLPVYPLMSNFRFWAWTDAFWLAIFFAILGLLQNTLVDSAVPAYTPAGRLTPYFIFAPVMILASIMAGNLINEQLRAPLIAMNETIQFSLDHQGDPIDPALVRTMHLGALRDISDLLDRPRRLFLGTYDDSFGQVNVLVDFNGDWVDCSTIYEQPVSCKPITAP